MAESIKMPFVVWTWPEEIFLTSGIARSTNASIINYSGGDVDSLSLSC